MTKKPESWNDFFIPGTEVLSNAFDIEDPKELEEAERKFSQLRQVIGNEIIPRTFDLEHLKTIHLNMFQDLYPTWAGEIRPVGINKGVNFTEPEFIESYARQIFEGLADNNYLKGLPRADFVKKAAELLGHLNALHPFREGNGRTQREFIRQLADEADFDFDLSNITPEQNNLASYISLAHGDDSKLEAMMDTAIKERLGLAA